MAIKMHNWKRVRLGEIAEYVNGMAFKPNEWSSEGLPIIRIQNLNTPDSEFNYCNFPVKEKYYVKTGDLLFAWSGTPGTSFGAHIWYGSKAVLNQHIFKVIFNESEIDKIYFKLALNYTISHFIERSHGSSGLAHIKKGEFEKSYIFLPPLQEQHRIVAKLDRIFERIDKAIALVEQNITNAQHLMASVLNEVFNEGVKDFQQVPLMKYVEFVGGSQPAKQYFSSEKKEGYVRLIQIRDYKSNDYIVYIKSNSTKKFCDETDVMIGRYGPPVFQILRGINGAYNVALMKARPDEKYISKDFLFWFLQNPNIQNYIIGISQRSAGQSGVNKSALEKYSIPLPPLEMQFLLSEKINQVFWRQSEIITKQIEKLSNLKALKSSLLDAAFKGEL